MAISMVSILVMITVLDCDGVFPVSEAINFPLDDCSKSEMDVLFLFLDIKSKREIREQQLVSETFFRDVRSFSSDKTTPSVKFAEVEDKFSADDPDKNVSSWSFYSSPGSEPYGRDTIAKRQRYGNVQEAVELKVRFIKRLFSDMDGVRQSANRIAVIFLDGNGLSREESGNIGSIVRQQDTNIKIFVVVVPSDSYIGTIYLDDVLLVNTELSSLPKHSLTLAICNHCMEGWFKLKHNDAMQSLSCYKLLVYNVSKNWYSASDLCSDEGGRLATIETKTELSFLQAKMNSYFSEIGSQTGNFNQSVYSQASVYIGLMRDSVNGDNRFKWRMSTKFKYRPLVFNNWAPGKPSEGRTQECGAWQFVWNGSSGENVGLLKESGFVDGWVNVDCEKRTSSFILCEIVIPHRTEGEKLVKIKPATNESISQALHKGDFILYGGNIVSVSSNIANPSFLRFIKELGGWEFPIFDCAVGEGYSQYISYLYVCDNVDHCSNRRDEALCTFIPRVTTIDVREQPQMCEGVSCCDGNCLPLHWVNNSAIDCFVCSFVSEKRVLDEGEYVYNYSQVNKPCAFTCNGNNCEQFTYLNDNSSNCLGIEGSINETLRNFKTSNICYNKLGQSIWATLCIYIRDRYGIALGCRNLSHLEDCAKFECPEGYFKCPNTYCIPQHYVQDGQIDCPMEEDEQSHIIDACTGNFACWDSPMCLYPDLVCDGYPDCPHRDDETGCRLFCFKGFRCISGTMTVSNYNKSTPMDVLFPVDKRVRYLDMSGINLSRTDFSTNDWKDNVVVVVLSNCSMQNSIIRYFSSAKSVRVLDLSYNHIEAVDGSYTTYSPLENLRLLNLSFNTEFLVFKSLKMKFIETLDLSHTSLSNIDKCFLQNLPSLRYLNLSYTRVTGFRINAFFPDPVLHTLDLRGLYFKCFNKNNFSSLTIKQHLYSEYFQLCCPQIRGPNIPDHTCHAPDVAISSCYNLIGNNVQRVLLWVVAVLAVLGNMTVIVYRVIYDRSLLRTGFGLFVTNLGISDFIMGAYLFIIAGADYYYRAVYVLFDQSWRESVACRIAGFLATLSCEASIFFVLLISLDRFLVMKFPFGQIKLSKVSKSAILFVSWTIGFLLAITPIAFNFQIYSSNAMCLALPLTTNRVNGWEFSFGVFTVLNMFMCLVIAFGQRAIFRAMFENRIPETECSTSPRRVEDVMVAKQLSLVVLFNFICWFPIGIMGLLSFSGYGISNEVFGWTTVFLLPVNSAANPLLYTIPVLVTKWEKFKQGGRKSR